MPSTPHGGVTLTQPLVFKKKLAVTNGCVGVTVLSKILCRMALPKGPTSYPFIYHFLMKGYHILFIGKINRRLSHTSLKHWSLLTVIDEPSFEYE